MGTEAADQALQALKMTLSSVILWGMPTLTFALTRDYLFVIAVMSKNNITTVQFLNDTFVRHNKN